MDIYHEILKRYWGYDQFRPLQEDIIHSVSAGKDTLGLMPTGGGKSLTFQVPAMAMEGLCLVVTPLIALMKDQVDNLRDRNIKALAVYSGMTRQEIITTLENAIFGDFKFLYVSPERLATQLFLSKLKDMNVCLLVVDESHCISQWGYDFRPSYLKIAEVRQFIPDVPVLALTATATPEVIDDIQGQLHFKEKNVFKKSFERKNLAYIVRSTENKPEELTKLLTQVKGSSIIYVRSRQRTKEISDFLVQNGFSSDFYHAGLSSADKTRKQSKWKNNETRIIVCTNAFGMGIDKPDVRLVVHTDLPNSIEEYFQEAGRAGRDEAYSQAVILYEKNDSTKLKKRVRDEFPDREFILHVYDSLAYFFQVAEGYGVGMIYDFSIRQFCAAYKLPLLPTHNALKILDLSGYIEYTEEIDNRSRLMFTVYRDDLYHYDFDRKNEQLVNTVLRLYTGLFTNYAGIDEAEIAIRLDMTRKDVYEMLKALDKRNIIDYIPHKKTPLIAYTRPRVESKYLTIPRIVNEDRKDRFGKRIEAMNHYAEQTEICRNRILLSYFGETETSDCRQCDVCKAKKDMGLTDERYKNISISIKKLLYEEKTITSIMESLSDFSQKDIVEVIRFMADRGEVVLVMDRISLKY
ncbi:ATP-dependent DNA helicase RecQ [Dysgonomonas sp. PFB1-18]|uniref:RecQ family ATP-dependent DNA helicase n=1 Tax=unclassified Dysgonomonas TaxID=2630389 RepID=UPI002475D11D|nr:MULTISPECIES: ATP-dependent DNA helicase RecQ [unclassified Dysgonomonas]MDH6309665.1 ATP-dependent DNA helicase RecQ [Dysgonomonas sp. PF1-14]MDH6339327.1 ATP-dependent DNA helicase RecQ [Dysgonomonas sp. PF1-16]MDH6380826.1 ATP-dependent DNA helicase RecQ [Dysgonomonas sp. PFB1-18]MDH6398322.1 ATP-dependent DNA helicase RecQ [Dysgonomonas sp. PF1-23]